MNVITDVITTTIKIREFYRYSLITRNSSQKPVISYWGMHKNQTGGAVKLHTLSKKFKENRYNFNILYLVSSNLPSHTESLIKVCKQKGIKVVWNQNGVNYPASSKNYKKLNLQMRLCMQKADYVIYQSNFCKKSANKYLGPFKGPQTVLYNPVNLKKFKPSKTKNKNLTLLSMGSIRSRERAILPLLTLNLLLKKKINARLIIGGKLSWQDGKTELNKITKKYNLQDHFSFIESYSQTDAPKIYRRADILIHMQDKDASPTVPLEALACGIPIIGINNGGMPELINKSSGILLSVPHSYDNKHYPTEQEIAKAVEKIYQKISFYRKGSLISAKKFSAQRWLKSHEIIFNSVLEK